MKLEIDIETYINKVVYKICYADTTRFIKITDLPSINQSFNAWLSAAGYDVDFKFFPDNRYVCNINKDDFLSAMDALDIGMNKTKVNLSTELAYSTKGAPLVYAYGDLSPFQNYWEQEDATSLTAKLYELLSQDIIENPYADAPNDYIWRKDQIAFHPNHGTTYGLRSATLLTFFYTILNEVIDMNAEEKACMQLAALLFRSGRTNEFGWSEDKKYSPRSAAIFNQIALELGYNAHLVNMISSCFDFKVDLKNNTAFTEQLQNNYIKAQTFQRLFRLVHTCELIRCNDNVNFLQAEMISTLKLMLEGEEKPKEIAKNALELAKDLCLFTGAPVLHLMLICSAQKGKGNEYRTVMTSNTVESTCMELSRIVHDKAMEKNSKSGFVFDLFENYEGHKFR